MVVIMLRLPANESPEVACATPKIGQNLVAEITVKIFA